MWRAGRRASPSPFPADNAACYPRRVAKKGALVVNDLARYEKSTIGFRLCRVTRPAR